MSELQIAGAVIGMLLSLCAMAGGRLATRRMTTLASWQAYTIAFTIRLIGFLVIAVGLAVAPPALLSQQSKLELFLAFVLVVVLGFIGDVVWSLLHLRKR